MNNKLVFMDVNKEKEMLTIDDIYDLLEESYQLRSVDETDNLNNSLVELQDCLDNGDVCFFYDLLDSYFRDSDLDAADKVLYNLVEEELGHRGITEEEVRAFINGSDYDDLDIDYESYQDITDYVRSLQTFDDNDYIYTLLRQTGDNGVLNVRVSGIYALEPPVLSPLKFSYSNGESAIGKAIDQLQLDPIKVADELQKLGVPCKADFPDFPERNGNECVPYASFANEVKDLSPELGNLTFLAKIDLVDMFENDFLVHSITIPKGNKCGFQNSPFEMILDKDLTVELYKSIERRHIVIEDKSIDDSRSIGKRLNATSETYGKVAAIVGGMQPTVRPSKEAEQEEAPKKITLKRKKKGGLSI
ncbi:hypothetical protein [Porphyromonas somerae]|uniref:hypothetical protein n=1 Tax=Porphyromonas somerae TaxID=322095 RepID=UPI00138ADF9F|nr:hypothetical protein [Porphyromonas somerae]